MLRKKQLKRERLKKVIGTFADENDALSDIEQSPRKNGISDEAYLKSVAQ